MRTIASRTRRFGGVEIRRARPRPLGFQTRVAEACRYLMYNEMCVGDSFSRAYVTFMSRKIESKTEVAAAQVPGQMQRLSLFGPPLLLEGEDAEAYDELLARMCAAVKPVDVIDEMLIADIVALEWEVLRWRRLKRTLMREPGLKALKLFLIEQLESNYALHREHFQ